ncbi:hypothetical protein GCM10010420_52250 [Streptomyces glaucosporus]|uniref:N-acetyltransferase domain-containing protein n=1 Tax=Streptomyces glaucosporus TaxID=284044 RepID=A0ABN3IWA3_9ACTN
MGSAAVNSTVTVSDSPAHGRFEARIGTALVGFADYLRTDGLVTYPRVVVSRPLRGRGIGDRLARAALDDARRRGLRVRPACEFIEKWIGLHPEYRELVAVDAQGPDGA